MLRFVSRRLLQVIPTLLLLSLLVFAWLRSLPGGPASAFLGDKQRPNGSPSSTASSAWTSRSSFSTAVPRRAC